MDSVLRCTFTRQINISGSVESIYSLTKKYFLLLGDGPIIGGNNTYGGMEHLVLENSYSLNILIKDTNVKKKSTDLNTGFEKSSVTFN